VTLPTVGYLGPDFALDVVREVLDGCATVVGIPLDAAALADAVRTLDGLVDASTRIPLGASALAQAPTLRIVSLASTGSSHIDAQGADEAGVIVRTLREDRELLAALTPAAEHTWALVLACARRLPAAAAHVEAGGWEREGFPGVMLNGRRLGIVGLGRIGGWVARYGAAFGMHVAAYDPAREDWPDDVERCSLDELFATSEVITVHVHLDETTRGLIDRTLLERCRPDTIVVNTSRGGVVDDEALVSLLREGRLGAVGLDVLAEEPPAPGGALLRAARELDRLIVTPHVGGFSPDAVRLVCRRAAEKVRDVLGSTPR
jgi:phosphoglycerate dehydrogenase-like enzyme